MPGLVFGGLALVVGLLLLRAFAKASPRLLARQVRAGGGLVCVALGAIMLLAGRPLAGVPLMAVGLGLLGAGMRFGSGGEQARPGNSTVRTALLEMEVNHATGVMRGRVLQGHFAGRDLSQLSAAELQHLAADADVQSLALLETYLERLAAGRGAHAQDDMDGRGSRADSGPMGEKEAYEILGLQPGSGADDIRRAHRALMMKLHPDQGGSTYLAARVNEAKEVLLRGHR